jgi:serine/threonine protein kinase/FixJ family two-component response regulator
MEETKISKGDILIVDDNPVNLNLLSGLLLDRNYRVRVATSGKRAISVARMAPPDLIMLDINMPEMDGYETCQLLKADVKTVNVPVIFISALDEVMDKVKAFQAGGVDYVTKPFQFEEVVVRLENQLKISRLQRELEKKNSELTVKNDELAQKNDALVRSKEELVKSYEKADKMFTALSDSLPGTVLDDKYRLEEKIGSGGFGVVYRAIHQGLNRPVAVKVFRPAVGTASQEDLERFRREGVSACRINHPNAIAVLDSSVTRNGMAYLVMELLEGEPLSGELTRTPILSLRRCAQILLPVCGALSEAHEAGIVHRDIKPDNIFLHKTKEGEVVKVVDFGIAKLLGEDSNIDAQNLTINGKVVGTPNYMAPERISGLPYDGRADVYSLGITLFRMLTGELPFQARNNDFWATVMMHLTKEPPSIKERNPSVPESVEAVVKRALAKNASERPTAKDLGEQFIAAIGNLSANQINNPTADAVKVPAQRNDLGETICTPIVTPES